MRSRSRTEQAFNAPGRPDATFSAEQVTDQVAQFREMNRQAEIHAAHVKMKMIGQSVSWFSQIGEPDAQPRPPPSVSGAGGGRRGATPMIQEGEKDEEEEVSAPSVPEPGPR